MSVHSHPTKEACPARTAAAALVSLKALENLWGNARIGTALVAAFYADKHPRSALEVAELTGLSDDTARRHLERLARIGRVDCTEGDRTRLYRASPALAERTLAFLPRLSG